MATQLGLLAQARGSASHQRKAARVAASECGQRASFKSGFQSESVGVFPAQRKKRRALCSAKSPLNPRYERDYWRRVAERGKLLMMKLPKLTAVIEPGEDGWYVANCPELGIVSQGETPEHAEEMIKEAVELWLECADESEVRRRLDERKVAVKELEVTHA